MNLAFLTKRYDTLGGTERDLYELTRRLAARGHEIHIYCCEQRREPEGGVQLHDVPVPGVGRVAALWGLARRGPRMAAEAGHDLVIAYARVLEQDIIRCGGSTHTSYLQQMAGSESAVRRAARRFDLFHRSMLRIERQQYTRGRYLRILAISEVVRRDILAAFDVPESAIEVIYDGVDTDHFHPRHAECERAAVRTRHGIPEGTPLLLFVGNAFKRKGLDTLLRGMAAMANQAAFLLVVGEDREAPAYHGLAASLGIADRVCFAGSRRDTHAYYAAADVFVLAALHEAFGNVVLEAMACGLPVVVSSPAGATEIIGEPLARYILRDPRNHAELAGLLDRFLAGDGLDALKRTARMTAEAFTLDANARATETFYERVLAEKRS